MPWAALVARMEPHYPKAAGGRRPYSRSVMLVIHCLQQWYGLSDPAMEEEFDEIAAMRQFVALSLGSSSDSDETTILHLRYPHYRKPH